MRKSVMAKKFLDLILAACAAGAMIVGAAAAQSAQPAQSAPPAHSSRAAPVAQTTHGRIRGYNDGPVKVFKGVPYGAPTGGANRWLPAKHPARWSGIKDTT